MESRFKSLSDCVGLEAAADVESAAVRRSWNYYAQADVTSEMVPLRTILPLARSVDRERLRKAGELTRMLSEMGIAPFRTHVEFGAAGVSVCLSPIVERHGRNYLVVDGMHRLVAAMASAIELVNVISVISDRLPSPTLPPCDWSDVVTVDYRQSREEKFPGYDPELFRPTAKVLDRLWGPHPDLASAIKAFTEG